MLGQCKDGCGLCTNASCHKVRANSRNTFPHSSEPCFLERVCVHASLLGEDVVTEARSLRRRAPPTPLANLQRKRPFVARCAREASERVCVPS